MNLMMNKILIVVMATVLFTACSSDDNHTGRTFVPDMQYSTAYEPYATVELEKEVEVSGVIGDSAVTTVMTKRVNKALTALKPVKGTISRAEKWLYHLENTQEGYEASALVENPIENSEKVLAHGKELYLIYCAVCHGKKGDGNGTLPESGKYPAQPPSYIDGPKKDLPQGTIFHVITYGKGMMGAHAGQLNWDERWKIAHYIQELKKAAN